MTDEFIPHRTTFYAGDSNFNVKAGENIGSIPKVIHDSFDKAFIVGLFGSEGLEYVEGDRADRYIGEGYKSAVIVQVDTTYVKGVELAERSNRTRIDIIVEKILEGE